MSNSVQAAEGIIELLLAEMPRGPAALAIHATYKAALKVISDNIPLADAEFIPDDHGGHIKYEGKVWRPEA